DAVRPRLAFEQARTALNVREEEGDGACWQGGHALFLATKPVRLPASWRCPAADAVAGEATTPLRVGQSCAFKCDGRHAAAIVGRLRAESGAPWILDCEIRGPHLHQADLTPRPLRGANIDCIDVPLRAGEGRRSHNMALPLKLAGYFWDHITPLLTG